jgi:hypothetical protein
MVGEAIYSNVNLMLPTNTGSRTTNVITLSPGDWDVSVGYYIDGAGMGSRFSMLYMAVSGPTPPFTTAVVSMAIEPTTTTVRDMGGQFRTFRANVTAQTVIQVQANATGGTEDTTVVFQTHARRMR